mmetsp:Transcript_1639/g.1982  ORF Transcript_1639/g.1982 Transcript_1639/m.1982 type:complete len:132 (+) Transcript_1639:1844-2239(+)
MATTVRGYATGRKNIVTFTPFFRLLLTFSFHSQEIFYLYFSKLLTRLTEKFVIAFAADDSGCVCVHAIFVSPRFTFPNVSVTRDKQKCIIQSVRAQRAFKIVCLYTLISFSKRLSGSLFHKSLLIIISVFS